VTQKLPSAGDLVGQFARRRKLHAPAASRERRKPTRVAHELGSGWSGWSRSARRARQRGAGRSGTAQRVRRELFRERAEELWCIRA
jgi:hypothetical protein